MKIKWKFWQRKKKPTLSETIVVKVSEANEEKYDELSEAIEGIVEAAEKNNEIYKEGLNEIKAALIGIGNYKAELDMVRKELDRRTNYIEKLLQDMLERTLNRPPEVIRQVSNGEDILSKLDEPTRNLVKRNLDKRKLPG